MRKSAIYPVDYSSEKAQFLYLLHLHEWFTAKVYYHTIKWMKLCTYIMACFPSPITFFSRQHIHLNKATLMAAYNGGNFDHTQKLINKSLQCVRSQISCKSHVVHNLSRSRPPLLPWPQRPREKHLLRQSIVVGCADTAWIKDVHWQSLLVPAAFTQMSIQYANMDCIQYIRVNWELNVIK